MASLQGMAEPITILYLITSTNAGGTEKALWELVRRLDPERFTAHVCSLKKPGLFGPRLEAAAAALHSLELAESGGLAAARSCVPGCLRLARLVHDLQPQIIHSFLFRANIFGRLAGRLIGTPCIISSLRVMSPDFFSHYIDRLTSTMVDMYTAVSEAVRQEAISRTGIAPEKIITIPNGIDCSALPAAALAERDPGSPFTIAVPARLHRQKGHAVLLQALKLLAGQQPEVRALLLGEGPEEGPLKKMAAHLGIESRVFFMGVFEDAGQALAGVDAVVLPSLWEGMPNAVLEAMALGKPVIASAIPGMDELVQDGVTGMLCQAGNAAHLAEALQRLACSPQLCRSMGQAGKERAAEHFSIDRTISATVALYERLLAGCGAAQG